MSSFNKTTATNYSSIKLQLYLKSMPVQLEQVKMLLSLYLLNTVIFIITTAMCVSHSLPHVSHEGMCHSVAREQPWCWGGRETQSVNIIIRCLLV